MQARQLLERFSGYTYIIYGDMPTLRVQTLQKLRERLFARGATLSILTLQMENPPEFGRILRDEKGNVMRVVEVTDASEEVRKIQEVNVGAYFVHVPALLRALDKLTPDNAQGEYYLTDIVEKIYEEGGKIITTAVNDIDEVLGVNAPYQQRYAEKIPYIQYAERLYSLIDAVAKMKRKKITA